MQDQAGSRGFAPHREGLQQIGVGGDLGPAVDPQGLVDAGDHEQQAGLGVGHHVAERIDPLVAAPIRDQQRPVVEHRHEARRVAAWRGIDPALGVRRRQHQEGRQRDEPPAVLVERLQRLAPHQVAGVAVEVAQVARVGDRSHRAYMKA